jgi:hypothetical protein
MRFQPAVPLELLGARNARDHDFVKEVWEFLDAIPGNHYAIVYRKPRPIDRLAEDSTFEDILTSRTSKDCVFPSGADFYLCDPMEFLAYGLFLAGWLCFSGGMGEAGMS